MIAKDPGKRHFYVSLLKSFIRLGACAALFTGDFATAAIMLGTAEVLGIAEEL